MRRAGSKAAWSSSYEKFIIDADQLTMFQRFAEGVDFSENGQALSAHPRSRTGHRISSAAPTRRPISRRPSGGRRVADNNSYEQWRDDGGKDAAQRANDDLEAACCARIRSAGARSRRIDEALQAFMAKRKETLPDTFA